MKIPKFNSQDEEMEFWSKHSALEFIEEGEEVKLDASFARAKRQTQQICLRISSRILKGVRHRAEVLGVPYQTLMQIWLAERLEAEETRLTGTR